MTYLQLNGLYPVLHWRRQGVGYAEGCDRPKVTVLTVCRLKKTVTSTVKTTKGRQQQLRLLTTPSRGTCMTAHMLHKSQEASSNLSRLTKKVT